MATVSDDCLHTHIQLYGAPKGWFCFRFVSNVFCAKYLGMHLDSKLTWREHITKKRKQLDLKTREINWLIGKNSPLSLENKLLIYKTVLKPIWTYGIALWGCASKSNISVIQRYQSKLLRTITNAPWYVTNQTLHSDLRYVHSVLQGYIHKHR